jgi:hypothetical protein
MSWPVARREIAPDSRRIRVAWLLTSSGLLVTGLLVATTAFVRWWGSCLPSAVYTVACSARQSGDLAAHHFPQVGDDLRAAAVLHAVTSLVSAATWLGMVAIGPPRRWCRIGTSIGAGGLIITALAELVWHAIGWRPLGTNLVWLFVLSWLILAVINFSPTMQFTAAEALASRRRGGARLTLLIITLLVAGPPGVFVDSLAWRAAFNATSDAGPGEGLLLAPSLVTLSIVIIVMCQLDARRPSPPSPERPDHPDRPDLTLAA